MTMDELQTRQTEIRTRLQELDNQYAGEALPEDQRHEWDDLNQELEENERLIEELQVRTERIRQIATSGNGGEREAGATFQTGRPDVVRGEDIWDLTTIRSTFASPDEARDELHDRCRRAIERANFGDRRVNREEAQAHVELLLQRDSPDGELGRLILQTGSPIYRRAFGKWVMGKPHTPEEQRAFSLASTGIPIPYTLDPTIIPISSSVVNPLRAISNVGQIVGSNEWRATTSAAITVARAAEGVEATDNTPTLAQPVIVCSRVQGFVPFSIESGQDWAELESNMLRLFADAKDDEEATAFYSGNGTPPNPFGFSVGTTTTVALASGLTISAANVYSIENSLPPRWRPRAQWVANRAIYSVIRGIDTAGGAALWLRIGEGLANQPRSEGGFGNTGYTLAGYPANELSTAPATIVNAAKTIFFGDFSMFKIIDRVGMTVDLIPHLFGAVANYPTGQRGLYAFWRNGSKVLDAGAFRAGNGTT